MQQNRVRKNNKKKNSFIMRAWNHLHPHLHGFRLDCVNNKLVNNLGLLVAQLTEGV